MCGKVLEGWHEVWPLFQHMFWHWLVHLERDTVDFFDAGVYTVFSLPPPVGRQVSQRLAEEARKRERFEELKQHLEQEQEVCVRVSVKERGCRVCVCARRFKNVLVRREGA